MKKGTSPALGWLPSARLLNRKSTQESKHDAGEDSNVPDPEGNGPFDQVDFALLYFLAQGHLSFPQLLPQARFRGAQLLQWMLGTNIVRTLGVLWRLFTLKP
jgi:hypothetical protein